MNNDADQAVLAQLQKIHPITILRNLLEINHHHFLVLKVWFQSLFNHDHSGARLHDLVSSDMVFLF